MTGSVWLRPGPGRWRAVAFVVAFVALVLMGVTYTNIVQRESDRRWCDLLAILSDGPPPTSERGKALAVQIARLQDEFGC